MALCSQDRLLGADGGRSGHRRSIPCEDRPKSALGLGIPGRHSPRTESGGLPGPNLPPLARAQCPGTARMDTSQASYYAITQHLSPAPTVPQALSGLPGFRRQMVKTHQLLRLYSVVWFGPSPLTSPVPLGPPRNPVPGTMYIKHPSGMLSPCSVRVTPLFFLRPRHSGVTKPSEHMRKGGHKKGRKTAQPCLHSLPDSSMQVEQACPEY